MIYRSHSRFITFCLVLFLCSTTAAGQELPFSHYSPENESVTLPSAEVFSVFQDNLGYMWFVIYSSGLYRYNGHKADLYTESDGLPAVTVHQVVQDKFGRLWAGTNEGLAVSIKPLQDYRGDEHVEFTTTLAGSQLVTTSVVRNRMTVDNQGRLLVGTEQAGVVRYDFPNLDTVLVDTIRTDFAQPGTNKGVRSMALRQNGSIWVALADGQLCIWATGYGSDLKPVGSEYNPPSIETEVLFEDSEGRLWGGCRKGLVWRLLEQGTDWTFETFSQDLQADVADIKETQDGVIWIASNGSGVLRYEGRQLSIVSSENGLLSNLVNHMAVDREGNLWLAQSGGVSKLRANYRAYSNYPTDAQQNGLPIFTSAALNAVLPPEGKLLPGGIWVGTDDGGMEHLSEGGFEIIDRSRGLRDDRVNALIRDENGRLWVGTGDGIHCLSIGNVPPPPRSPETTRLTVEGHNTMMATFEHHSIYAAASLSMPVRSGSSERLESLWFLGYQHLYCFVADQWFLFKPSAGLPGTRYHTVALDGQDKLWVGTRDAGVYRSTVSLSLEVLQNLQQVPEPTEAVNASGVFGQLIVDEIFEPIWNKSTGAATNQIEMLIWYVDEMWVAKPEGLTILKPDPLETVTVITRENGLLANNVTSMDRSPLTGNLWVGTNAGLAEIDMDEHTVVRVVTKADGLVDNEGWYFGSVRVGQDGNVHFGTAKGLSIYRPELDVENGHMPLLQLERSDFSQKGGGDNEINFEYAALSFSQERKVQYRTRLVGFDEDWSQPTTEYKIRYTNLPALFVPREYTFEVMATSNGQDWTEEPLQYSFSVKPAWYLRWWTFVIEAALLAGILFFYLRYKNTQHKKELKRERDISMKLQQVDKLKDQFLANTSHELRTPLNGIIGLAESLIDREQDQHIRKDLSMIFASGKRLANLVNDILDFSKMKNQDLVLQSQPVGLHTIVEVVLRLSEPLIIQKDLKLINQVDEDLPLVMGDENRIEQVLHNLVGNAIKFTETGSVTISAEVRSEMVAVSVADTGIGVPENKFNTIFQSFEQADGSTAREYGGTGLGLSVSKQLIELHGGSIEVTSKVGEGSTFTFTLPMSSEEALAEAEKNPPRREELVRRVELDAPVEVSAGPEPEKKGKEPKTNGVEEAIPHASLISSHPVNILVVDDEPVNRQVLENHLSLAGYSVTQASNGPEALKIMQNGHDFDLILLDIMMPRMSGYEVCHRLREIYLPSELPVVMLTAKNRVSDLVEGFDLGANDYLIKPFSKEELLTRIKTHLNLHRVHQATGRFVPNEFLRSVGRDSITDVELGDHMEKEVTVFFSDIRSYTTLSENMTPQENFKFVNAYVGRMGPLIKDHKGFVNQYLGDGIMAIFPRDASHALRSSIEQQREVQVYNDRRSSKGKIPITIGIGMHTGPLVMGIIGDSARNDTATISDTVNAASRMEGLTKYYGANIIISGDGLRTVQNQDEFNIRYLSKVQVKGKNEVIEAYECFDGDSPEMIEKKISTLPLYEEGLKQYFEKDFAAATGTFGLILRENAEDKVARYFLSKSAGFIQTGVPDDWTGIVKWDSK